MGVNNPTGTGGGGSATSKERRHQYANPLDYCGTAAVSSAESDAVWTIVRLTVASDGTDTTGTATPVKWTDRVTATYT